MLRFKSTSFMLNKSMKVEKAYLKSLFLYQISIVSGTTPIPFCNELCLYSRVPNKWMYFTREWEIIYYDGVQISGWGALKNIY